MKFHPLPSSKKLGASLQEQQDLPRFNVKDDGLSRAHKIMNNLMAGKESITQDQLLTYFKFQIVIQGRIRAVCWQAAFRYQFGH